MMRIYPQMALITQILDAGFRFDIVIPPSLSDALLRKFISVPITHLSSIQTAI